MGADPASTSASPLVRDERGGMAPADASRSYYGRGILNKPVWTWEIPVYFFTGGLAGASSVLAAVARGDGNVPLERAARRVAAGAALASPPLLIADLGRPQRFHHMLRVMKPTSPMSMGSWLLAAFVPLQASSTVLSELGWFPRLQRLTGLAAAALGPMMTTYTAVLFSNTAVPVWHDARNELPWLFTGGAAASAGASAVLLVPGEEAGPAQRLAVAGGVTELLSSRVMEKTLGELAEPYKHGAGGRWSNIGEALTGVGTTLVAASGRFRRRRRRAAVTGAVMLLVGAMCERWAVFRAGSQSATDPKYTVEPQRRRIDDTGNTWAANS